MANPLTDWDFGARFYAIGNVANELKSSPQGFTVLPPSLNILPTSRDAAFNNAARSPVVDGSAFEVAPTYDAAMNAADSFLNAASGETTTVEVGEGAKEYTSTVLGTLFDNVGLYVGRGVVVVLGFIFIAGGILLFPRAQAIAKEIAK